MKITKPYKGAKLADISQKFGVNPNIIQPNGHTGVDFVSSYGTWLQAPERVQITNIINNLSLQTNSEADLRRGYGIVMKSLSQPDTYYLYWHCLPVFPVKINDIVEQGEGVAQMGNSGYVIVGGKYVPIGNRVIPPFKGKHLHYEAFTEKNGKREYFDPLPLIDWSLPDDTSILDEIQRVLSVILNIINK